MVADVSRGARQIYSKTILQAAFSMLNLAYVLLPDATNETADQQ